MDKDSIPYYHSLFIIHTTATHQALRAGFCGASQERQPLGAALRPGYPAAGSGERGETPLQPGFKPSEGETASVRTGVCARACACVLGSVRVRVQ